MNLSKKVVSMVVAGAIMAGGGIVAAMWSSTGTGSGQTKALTAQVVTVSAAIGAADLYPGFTAGDVSFTLTNANPYPVTFTSMAPGTIVSSNPGSCPSTNVTVISKAGLTLPVGANLTSGTLSIADVVTMVAGAPDGCQGATFTIGLTLTGSQV